MDTKGKIEIKPSPAFATLGAFLLIQVVVSCITGKSVVVLFEFPRAQIAFS